MLHAYYPSKPKELQGKRPRVGEGATVISPSDVMSSTGCPDRSPFEAFRGFCLCPIQNNRTFLLLGPKRPLRARLRTKSPVFGWLAGYFNLLEEQFGALRQTLSL